VNATPYILIPYRDLLTYQKDLFERGHFRRLIFFCDFSLLFYGINLKNVLRKILTSKIDSAVSPRSHESTWNMSASLGLRWWQHVILSSLHEYCIAAKVTGSRKKLSLYQVFSYVHQILPFRPKSAEDDCRSISLLLLQSVGIKLRPLILLEYIHRLMSYPIGSCMFVFPIPLIWELHCCKYRRTSTAYRKLQNHNIKYFLPRSFLTRRSWVRASWYNFASNQQDATIQVNLLFLVSSACFGRCFSPSSGALSCIYSIW
jgi:hypothetical protein